MNSRSWFNTNAPWNIAEVIGSGAVLFILYKLILQELGVSALGTWSLVLSTTSLARLADFGAAGGLGRYVAVSRAERGQDDSALIYVETALISNLILYAAIGCALYYPASVALRFATHGAARIAALQLLPYAIASLTIGSVANVAAAALIGYHRSRDKSRLMIVGQCLQLVLSLATMKHLGLRGVAMAQVTQYTFVTIAGWALIVRASLGHFSLKFPHRFAIKPLRELLGFGIRLQGLNIASFLFDPFTKYVISAVAGIEALGTYEAASRGILQIRQLVVAPSQNLTPVFAEIHARDPLGIRAPYEKALAVITASGVLAMVVACFSSPLLSLIWFGKMNSTFIIYSIILCFGWMFNILSTPGYYVGIASGTLRWNIVGGTWSTIVSPILGYVLSFWLGSIGVCVGAMAGMATGSMLTAVMNCRMFDLRPLPSLQTLGGALAPFFGRMSTLVR